MVKILYGLCGIGIGHIIRGRVILEYLLKQKHNVFIVCPEGPYAYLSARFENVHKIPGFELVFKKNSVRNFSTFVRNIKKVSIKTYTQLKNTYKEIKKFKPRIVISDWESFSSFTAKRLKVPSIGLYNENQHFFTRGEGYLWPKTNLLSYLKARLVLAPLSAKTTYDLITTFARSKLKERKEKGIFVTKPILRKDVLNIRPKEKDYILVYQSSKTYKKLLALLGRINYKFIIYGFDKAYTDKNLTFKQFSEKGFIMDLANASAVITNGGFNLITEAIQLGKPVLSVPIKGHFEQLANAVYIKSRGYGEYHSDLNKKIINDFIVSLKQHKHKFKRIKQKDNSEFFSVLDSIIEKEQIYSKK